MSGIILVMDGAVKTSQSAIFRVQKHNRNAASEILAGVEERASVRPGRRHRARLIRPELITRCRPDEIFKIA